MFFNILQDPNFSSFSGEHDICHMDSFREAWDQ